jgi:hypothetical protein
MHGKRSYLFQVLLHVDVGGGNLVAEEEGREGGGGFPTGGIGQEGGRAGVGGEAKEAEEAGKHGERRSP